MPFARLVGVVARSGRTAGWLALLAVLLGVSGYFIVGIGALPCSAENSTINAESPQGEACDLVTGFDVTDTVVPFVILALLAMLAGSLLLVVRWAKGQTSTRAVAMALSLQLVVPVGAVIALYLPANTP